MDQESLSKGHPSLMAIASLLRLAAALDTANGKITRKTGHDTPPETYSAIEGLLTGIGRRRYTIIIFNALASTLWQYPVLQEMFLGKIQRVTGIDADIWRRETARIRYSTASRSVGRQAIALRASLCTALGVPEGRWL